jgi:hypothetical protein
MNKESLNKNLNQNQNVKTGWEDVADYLPKNLENSQDNEKRERSFEKIGEYTVKNIEKNPDGSYNFLGINPEEEKSNALKGLVADQLFRNYLWAYHEGKNSNKIEKRRKFLKNNIDQVLKGNILDELDFSKSGNEVLVQEYNIDGLNFKFFNAMYEGMGAIVKDEDGVMKTRAFRESGSDHQFKSAPGMEEFRWIKGNEWDPNKHYVQSGKLDPRVYEILSDLSEKKTPRGSLQIAASSLVTFVRNLKEQPSEDSEKFEFSEKQHEFKDEKWNRMRQNLTKDFKKFMDIKQYGRTYDSSKMLSEEEYAKKFDERFIKNEKLFSALERSGMVPDFSRKPDVRYFKDNGNIRIEEFIASSDKGDNICWSMATDRQNRVYIDDIFTPDVPVDSYGTPSEKTNMGMLIYKPEDYASQNRGLPNKYVKERKVNGNAYEDISDMLKAMPPVQKYMQALRARRKRNS